MMKIAVKEVVGENAISMQSGQILYKLISNPLMSGEEVELDFKNVELFASPFFNASIGFLLKDVKVDDLKQRLKVENISNVGRQLLNHVISNAIKHYEREANAVEDLKIIIRNAEER